MNTDRAATPGRFPDWLDAGRCRWLVPALGLVLGWFPLSAAEPPAELTDLADFFQSPPDAISRGLPVRIRGVVTYVDVPWRLVVVQQGERGIYLQAFGANLEVARGQEVQLTGTSTLVAGNHRVNPFILRPTGSTNPIIARPVELGAIENLGNAFAWIETEQRVAWAMELDGRPHLALSDGDKTVLARILPPSQLDLSGLVGARVRVQGVVSRNDDIRLPAIQSQLRLPGDDFLQVLAPPPFAPFAAAPTPIGTLAGLAPDTTVSWRCVHGFVVEQTDGSSLSLRDQSGSIKVVTTLPQRFSPGQAVEAAGFFHHNGGRLELRQGLVRPKGANSSGPATRLVTDDTVVAFPSILTNLAAVCALSPTAAARRLPVRTRVIVTAAIPRWAGLFLSDDSGSLYANGEEGDERMSRLQPGDQLELEAVTTRGEFKPMLTRVRLLTVISNQPLPRAYRATAAHLRTGAQDCERVELQGVVRSVRAGDDINLLLDDNGTTFLAFYPGATVPTNLVGSVVSLRGASGGRFDGHGNVVELTLWMNGFEDLNVLQPADAAPRRIDPSGLGYLSDYELLQALNHRVVIEGTVLQAVPGHPVQVEFQGRGLRLLSEAPGTLAPGDRVEAVGYLALEQRRPLIRNAQVNKIGNSPPPVPVPLAADQLLNATFEQRLVELEAQVLGRKLEDIQQPGLTLQVSNMIFTAHSLETVGRDTLPEVRPGAIVRIRGIYTLAINPLTGAPGFSIAFEPKRDLAVVQRAPWWSWRHTAGTAGGLSVGLLGALIWASQLRRRVARQTDRIRQQIEKESHLERKYRDLIENAHDFIFSTDHTGRFTAVNPAGERLLGYSRAELFTRSFHDLVAPEQQAAAAHLLDGAATTAPATREWELLIRDGSRICVELSSQPITRDRQVSGFEGIARDVTGRKQAAAALQRSRDLLTATGRMAKVGGWEVELEPRVLHWTDEVYCIHEVPPGYVPEIEAAANFYVPEARPVIRELVTRAGEQGETFDVKLEIITARGNRRWLRAVGEPVREGDRITRVSGTVQDITDQKRAEEVHERLRTELVQAQKMETVGRLAGGVAHDFNNMLQAILGNADLALHELPADSPVREDLLEIQKSALRSAELTRQLLAFARKQTASPRVLDLNDTGAGMLKMLRRLIGENLDLAWLPGAALWPVRIDPSQLDQILTNLCVNARDAISGTGRIIIETANHRLDDTYRSLHPEAVPGDYVLLAVSDNGQGMDAEVRNHLFEPFFTTKGLGKGTGLGLATVFGIVKQNLGLINVYSEPGRGTTFKIYLPRAISDTPAATAASPPPSTARGAETILLVEDEEQVLSLGRRILQGNGYTVLAAAGPEAAIALATQHPGPIDLLITDVVMPGINGKELNARLRALRPTLRTLFMSGYPANVIAHHGILEDHLALLPKPFTNQSLLDRVRQILAPNPADPKPGE